MGIVIEKIETDNNKRLNLLNLRNKNKDINAYNIKKIDNIIVDIEAEYLICRGFKLSNSAAQMPASLLKIIEVSTKIRRTDKDPTIIKKTYAE
jgi:hypothetical protein